MNPENLKDFLLQLVDAPELQPKNGVTFCNIAARRVMDFFGYTDFDAPDLNADEMVGIMKSWKEISGIAAAAHAIEGNLVFAGETSQRLHEAHGHIAAVFPAPGQVSPSLGRAVPLLANVGIRCGIIKSSDAFPVLDGEATYFLRA